MPPARAPHASPSAISIAVIGALLLRDMKTRAGTSFVGYFMMMVVPLLHLGAVVMIYHLTGRQIPVGTDPIVYLSLSVLPFVVFLYPSRQIMISVTSNRPLLAFPRVTILDIIVARGLLEFFTGWTVSIVLCLTILGLGSELHPRDPAGVLFAVAATIYFGFAVGMINALIASVLPIWSYTFGFLIPVFWISSGVLFFPASVPDQYRTILAYNPLLQCVEWLRYSWFENYPDSVLNVHYLLLLSTVLVGIALIAERVSRRLLLNG